MYPIHLAIAFSLFISFSNSLEHRRFEYKYSFKPPYLAQKDGTVPFWEYGGNAIASSENVRIAPSLRSQKGAIWTKSKTNFDWWNVEIVFRITGRGRIGADGLAFWYTESKGAYDGDVFGSSDMWNGLGIFFDSFDNDNKHNNPYVMAVVNDGTKKFDHQNDGASQMLAGCLRDFRNKPFATRARIEYFQNTLTVLFHNGMTNNEADYDMCLRAENVYLPKNGHFGISAATGGLADDHDVFHFLTTSVHVGQAPEGLPGQQLTEEEQLKLSQEYQEYQRKLEQQKEEYRKEHPDHNKEREPDMDDWFESDNQRELRQIFQGQSAMADIMKDLSRKLDEVIGRQERTLSLVSQGQPMAQVQGGAPVAVNDGIRRHEVDLLMNSINALVTTIREVRSIVGEVHARSDAILSNQGRASSVQNSGGGIAYDVQALIGEMRDGMNTMKQGMAGLSHKMDNNPSAQVQCPTQNCVSVTIFLVAVAVQLALMLAYSLYKDSKEAQAKKFY
ncbi:protein ERGIC-53-like [Ctenocephalides felis]|uniref:protein ERGIC-53-like n=1 Tax=Ctenocephalides felis TaxID=7515 RepID=UPI000E6E5348|nr:protein ERGIC-53-like [Ctenocephalides felis]